MNRFNFFLIVFYVIIPCYCLTQEKPNWFSDSLKLPELGREFRTKKIVLERMKSTGGIRRYPKFRTMKRRYKYKLSKNSENSIQFLADSLYQLRFDTILFTDTLSHQALYEITHERQFTDGTILSSQCNFKRYLIIINTDTIGCTVLDNYKRGEFVIALENYHFMIKPSIDMSLPLFCIQILNLPKSTKFKLIGKGEFYKRKITLDYCNLKEYSFDYSKKNLQNRIDSLINELPHIKRDTIKKYVYLEDENGKIDTLWNTYYGNGRNLETINIYTESNKFQYVIRYKGFQEQWKQSEVSQIFINFASYEHFDYDCSSRDDRNFTHQSKLIEIIDNEFIDKL